MLIVYLGFVLFAFADDACPKFDAVDVDAIRAEIDLGCIDSECMELRNAIENQFLKNSTIDVMAEIARNFSSDVEHAEYISSRTAFGLALIPALIGTVGFTIEKFDLTNTESQRSFADLMVIMNGINVIAAGQGLVMNSKLKPGIQDTLVCNRECILVNGCVDWTFNVF